MHSLKPVLQVLLLLAAYPAVAQDALPALPAVPTAGISPVLSWALSLLSIVLTITLPIAVAFLKQRLDTANTADKNAMIDRAVKRGALISYGNQIGGATPSQAAADGLAYVKNAVPDAIKSTDQATDTHLANAVAAEVIGLNQTGASVAAVSPADIIIPKFVPVKGP
jgi:hypothetical protein